MPRSSHSQALDHRPIPNSPYISFDLYFHIPLP